MEGIVLHAFEGKAPFDEASRRRIGELKRIYGLELDAAAYLLLINERMERSGRELSWAEFSRCSSLSWGLKPGP